MAFALVAACVPAQREAIPLALATSPQSGAREAPAGKIKIAYCTRSWGEARYRAYGYDHVVHVVSECDKPVLCSVSTDVDPAPISVRLEPEAHVKVLTRRGSPSKKFVPRVACRFVDDD